MKSKKTRQICVRFPEIEYKRLIEAFDKDVKRHTMCTEMTFSELIRMLCSIYVQHVHENIGNITMREVS